MEAEAAGTEAAEESPATGYCLKGNVGKHWCNNSMVLILLVTLDEVFGVAGDDGADGGGGVGDGGGGGGAEGVGGGYDEDYGEGERESVIRRCCRCHWEGVGVGFFFFFIEIKVCEREKWV